MKTSEVIENAFKEIVLNMPYGDITVKLICDRANVSRKTFYCHFQDKEDIVRSLFTKHVIEPFRGLDTIAGFLDNHQKESLKEKQLYEAIYAEREYYYALVKPIRGNDDTFLRVVTWLLYDFNIETMARHGFKLNDIEKDYIAYFFASSQAMLLQKWISDNMPLNAEDMSNLYLSLTSNYWHNLAI